MKPSYRIAVALSTLFLALPAYGHGVSTQVFVGFGWILFLFGMTLGMGIGMSVRPRTRPWLRHSDDDEKWWRKKPD